MTLTNNSRHEGSDPTDPNQAQHPEDGPGSDAEQMSQAALASMHPDLHEFDWRYYHNALQM